MSGYVTNIERDTIANQDFRRVLYTGPERPRMDDRRRAGRNSGTGGAGMEARAPWPAHFSGGRGHLFINGTRRSSCAFQRDYGFLQRVFWESIDSIAVPTTGIVLSILAGSLQSSSVR